MKRLNIIFKLAILLLMSSMSFGDCGLNQNTVEERIEDCKSMKDSIKKVTVSGTTWKLVSYKSFIGRNYQVWLDTDTGLLWGDRSDNLMQNHQAIMCMNSSKKSDGLYRCDEHEEKFCSSDEGKNTYNNISERTFGIPSLEEFKIAYEHGIEVIHDNYKFSFWTTYDIGRINEDEHIYHYKFNANGFYQGRSGFDKVYSICVGRKDLKK